MNYKCIEIVVNRDYVRVFFVRDTSEGLTDSNYVHGNAPSWMSNKKISLASVKRAQRAQLKLMEK
jgi:hypothetical protein